MNIEKSALVKRHQSLIVSWINNMVKNQINDEIVMLLCKTNFDKDNLVKKLNISVSVYPQNYEILDIRELTSINEIGRNYIRTNTIILTNSEMEADKFVDCNFILMFVEFGIFEKILLDREKYESEEKPTISIENRYLHYIEKRDPLEFIRQCNAKSIRGQLHSFFKTPVLWNTHCLLKRTIYNHSKYSYNVTFLYDLEDEDIPLLLGFQLLTSQLAILIYKSTTLKFYDTDTKIGNYYRKKLGMKSKATHIPNSKPVKKIKAYHLKNWKA